MLEAAIVTSSVRKWWKYTLYVACICMYTCLNKKRENSFCFSLIKVVAWSDKRTLQFGGGVGWGVMVTAHKSPSLEVEQTAEEMEYGI